MTKNKEEIIIPKPSIKEVKKYLKEWEKKDDYNILKQMSKNF